MKFSKQEISWILYDCGNSAYTMAITSALIPVYFSLLSSGRDMELGYFNSIASLIVALLSPILGTIADYRGKKKMFFNFFSLTGIFFTASLAFVPYNMWQLLMLFYILSALGFSGSNIFYDSFLVDVSSNENMDRVSSLGFAYGYIASIIPFGFSLGIVYFLGMTNPVGFQISFVITAIWWFVLTIPMYKNVHQSHYIEPEPHFVKKSFKRLGNTLKNISKHRTIVLFLLSYFLYIDGVDTIIKMAVPFAKSVLAPEYFNTVVLLGILLLVQIVAFPCAIIFGKLSKKYSPKIMIMIGILMYIFITTFAYNMTSLNDVFILGGLIGLVQGGIQAISRSYYARLIPKQNSNEFFGFYNVFGKFAAILGPFLMAFTSDITGSPRASILAIIPLFIIGFVIFIFLPSGKTAEE